MKIMYVRTLMAVVVLATAPMHASRAAALALFPLLPDLEGTFGNVTYTYVSPTEGSFSFDGFFGGYSDGAGHPLDLIDTGSYNITANINPTTGYLVSGTLSIEGDVTNDAISGVHTLLTANLRQSLSGPGNAWGFTDAPASNFDLFEFLFDVTGGDADIVADFGGNNSEGGIILDANFDLGSGDIPFDGNWTHSFSSSQFNGVVDAFSRSSLVVVPEPSATVLFALGMVAVAMRRRRKVMSSQAAASHVLASA